MLGRNLQVPVSAFLVVFAAQIPDALAVNLFTNADMENCPALPHNTPPTGWGNSSTSLGADCEFWATGVDPGLYAGTRSPRIQYMHMEGITQSVSTTPGKTYWVSFYIAGNGGLAEIRYDSYSGATITSVPITSAYTLVTGSFVAATAMTTIYIGANLMAGGASGDARIDDACIATSLGQCGSAAPACGDGNVDPGEACDDGNTMSGDGCNATCSSNETCGNGVVDDGERCDDGNTTSGDGCSAQCASDETCGNGTLDTAVGEACDDGNTQSGDGCQANCQLPNCGDGILDPAEVCDDGNMMSGDGCNALCSSNETCGNGILDTAAGEACDDANTKDGDGCQANCALPTCGDGTKDPAETCDDGNTKSGDGCSATCISNESCGNGILDAAAGEACDDANTTDGDGCESTCLLPDAPDTPNTPVEEGSCGCRIAGDGAAPRSGIIWATALLGIAGMARRAWRDRPRAPHRR